MGIYIEYDKPFLTYDEQINYLETKYNLKIDDKEFARSALSTISYYDLIKRLVFDYISMNKLPLNLIQRLELLLNW